jgi:hypothetical protein
MQARFLASGGPVVSRLTALGVLVLAAGLAACDSNQLAAPTIRPSYGQVCDESGNEYTLVEGHLTAQVNSASAWIDREGGWIHLPAAQTDGHDSKHSIYIPANAVSQKTLFTLSTIAGQYVGVELSAQVQDASGNWQDVSDKGLAEPASLVVSYKPASNVSGSTSIVLLRGDGLHHVPTKATTYSESGRQFVVATLPRISKYVVGMQ